MYSVELYMRVRRACMVDGMSIREASRMFGVHRDTVRKMLEHPVPPGYRMRRPRRRRKLERYTEVIDQTVSCVTTSTFRGSSVTRQSGSTSV